MPTTTTTTPARVRVVARIDDFAHDNPFTDDDAIEIVSFNRRHRNYADPDDYQLVRNEYGDLSSECVGFRRKLATGTAFILSAYQHGQIVWSLQGSGPQCRWDTAQVAGVLTLDPKVGLTGDETTPEERYDARRKAAETICRVYTEWCNGSIYTIAVECNGEVLTSLSGAYASDVDDYVADLLAEAGIPEELADDLAVEYK